MALAISFDCAYAQAPNISYTPSTNVYTVGTAITNLSPTNAGGAVPATTYGTVTTFAGNTSGVSGRTNGTGTAAKFYSPSGITINSSGTMFIADYSNNEIREITSAAVVTLLAGASNGGSGRTNATGTSARFNGPNDITLNASTGNMYVADYNNNEIREVTSAGVVTLLAGSSGGGSGRTNATGTSARFNGPWGVIFDPVSGAMYVSDYNNNEIRKVTTAGVVTLFAGSATGASGLTNATGSSARFNGPTNIAVDASGNVYVADQNNNEIRKITPAGVVTLFAGDAGGASGSADGTGSAATFNAPNGITVDASGNVYVSDSGNNNIRMITPAGVVTTIAGDGTANYTDGLGTAAEFNYPTGLHVDPSSGNIFVTDNGNNVIREIVATGYTISGALPAGLSFDPTTGIISGTPTTVSSATNYTITAYNLSGSSATTVNITVNLPAAPTVSGGGSGCGGSITLSASGGTPSGGTYNWYNVSSGGSSIATGSTYTPTSSGTYYASYTYSGTESSRSSGTSVTLSAGPAISSAPTSGGLYFSYPFSGNANDVSGSGNNGTVQNGASLTTDRYNASNSAYSFNGSNQYISTSTSTASPGPQNFSISAWFKTSSAGGLLVGFGSSITGSSGSYDRHIYMNNSGQIYYGLYPGTVKTINTTSTYADGNWHHVVATTSTTSGSNLYVDGVLQATDATMTTSQSYTGYWRVAYDNINGWTSQPSSFYFNGSLDDIAVYNTAISASQVATLYGASVTSPVCAGSTLSLSVNTVSGATYSWSGPNSFSSSSQNPTVSSSATTAMAGTYTCTVSSAGCSSSINVTAVVNAAPSATFTATSSISAGGSATITYTGTDPSTSTYSWTFTGGSPSTGSGQGPFSVTYSAPGTYTASLTITNSNGCSSTSSQTITVNGVTLGAYGFSKSIVLNTSSIGISSTLSNFPALVYIQDNDLKTGNACGDKVQFPTGNGGGLAAGTNYDFAFTLPGSTSELNYQVESYDSTNGILLAWVQIPSLTSTNTNLTFYFGSPSPAHTAATAAATWASDYKAVYHFNEGSTSATVLDATGNAANATQTNTALGTGEIHSAAGITGGGYVFNGASTKIISTATANITGSFTLSAWVNVASYSTGTDQKVVTNEYSYSNGGYKLSLYGTSTTNVLAEVETRNSTGGVSLNRSASGGTPLSTGTWYYVQGIFDSSSSTFYTYRNGVLDRTYTGAVAAANGSVIYMGSDFSSGYWFNGTMDEVRISNVAKSADWIKAEYYNQTNPLTFTDYSGGITAYSTNASALTGALTYTWTGAVSTDPTVAGNWDIGQTPVFNGNTSLVINTSANVPALTADESIYALTIASGASLNLNGHTLSVGCNIYNSSTGQILYGTSTNSGITWNGSASTQTYTGSSSSNTAALGNMTINNSAGGTVTISGGPVDIYNSLTITKGNLVVGSSPAALTLKSTATQTAGVAAIPSGYSITGTVTCERYITGGSGYRAYRLISSPVYAATVSSNNIYSINYLQSSIYLTGNSGGGFDKTGNPTLYLFREDQTPSNASFTSGNFWGISAINNTPSYNYYLNGGSTAYNIPAGNGMMFFFRGNRSSASLSTETLTSYTTPVTATLSASGTLNQGQVVVHNWYTPSSAKIAYTGSGTGGNYAVRGINLVGNPYPSSIDWSTFSNTTSTAPIYGPNVSPTIWTFDPGTKNYATYNATTNISTGNGGKIIASGQGFFVLATGASPSLTFQESAKTTAQVTGSQLLMARRTTTSNLSQGAYNSYIRIKLVTDSVNYNDMVIGFNQSSATEFNAAEDSKFVAGMGNRESISAISSDGVNAAVKWVPLPKNRVSQVIRLHTGIAATGQYTLQRTEMQQIPALYQVWLIDRYKKDSLDFKNNATYIFDANLSDTASYGDNRFRIVVRQDPALMVHLLNFTAMKSGGASQVAWVTENEANYTNFALQRSTDGGATYAIIDGLASSGEGTYSFLDNTPAPGANSYRLQITDLNGNITYSNVVTLMYGNSAGLVKTGIVVYPNPAKSTLNVSVATGFNATSNNLSFAKPGTAAAVYDIRIADVQGSVIKEATTTQQNWQTDVSGFMPGTYVLQVINKSNNTVVGQGTFLKL
jgi:sugar lactone lactonase YvrE